MEDKQPSAESSSASEGGSESSESVVELNVKTLDSRIYKFHVDKNMPVSLFKEKIANETGLTVVQQRLIFRGKVLKDDQLLSEYHVDNGHTLHLVERQPSESQNSGSSTGETSTNNGGQDAGVTGSHGRVGHISHSVVLGTLNLGDQGEGVVPDLSRVLGAVLNSIGIGAQMPGGVPIVQVNAPGQPQQNATERSQNGSGVHSQASGQTQQGQGLPDQSLPHVLRIPIGTAIPVPTLQTPIPDSLRTLSDFISRMEHVLSQNGYGPNQPSISAGDSSTVELPSNAHGLPTHESLSIVLRQAERLLSSHATTALSHIAGRLEREGNSTDPTTRGHIQTESIQVGMAMQHLGSLLLELGRTILSLRMGQSPAESFVNSGHAVYISSFGPNPIMVQPFPLQATTMFGASPPNPSNQGSFGPVGIGAVPRNVNIHIHAVGPGGAVMEGSQADGHSGTGDSGQTGQAPESVQLSSVIAGLNSQFRNFGDNGQNGNPVLSENINAQSGGVDGSRSVVQGTAGYLPQGKADSKFDQLSMQDGGGSSNARDIPSGSSGGDRAVGGSENAMSVPLGLGVGGLKPKRRVKPERSQDRRSSSESGGSDDSNVEEQMRVHAHQVLETLKSFTDRTPETPSARQMSMQRTERGGGGGGGQSSNSQFDISNAMSQVFSNPAFSGLLAGVSEQAGIGSPDMLRDMMMQITQNPGMRNTISQMAQQFEGQDLGNMFGRAGAGGGGGGGMDFSSMFQQMMPLVSQMLGGGSNVPGMSAQSYEAQRRLGGDDVLFHNIQVDLQDVVERIVNQDAPREIFCSMVEAAAQLDDTCSPQLIEELCDDEGLAKEFMELLRQDISRRLEGQNKNS